MTREKALALTEELIDAADEYRQSMRDVTAYADGWQSRAGKDLDAVREKVIAALTHNAED